MSKIKLKNIKCPVCAAPLKLKDEGYGQTTCEYCGAIVYASREDTTQKGDITVYSKEENKPIAKLNIPIGWDVVNTFINYGKCTMEIPYGICVDIDNNMGSVIHVETGNGFEGFGAASYLGQTQAAHTIQKDFETVDEYLDEFISEFAKSTNTDIKFVKDIDIPVKNYDRLKDFKDYQVVVDNEIQKNRALGINPSIMAMYCDSACRMYEGSNGKVIVAYTKEYGYMLGMGGLGSIEDGISNLMQGVSGFIGKVASNINESSNESDSFINKMANSGLLGGMLGKKYKTNSTNKKPTKEVKEEVKEVKEEIQQENPIYYGKFKRPGIGQTYVWMSDPIFVLITTKEECDNIIKKAYKQVCSSFKLSPEVIQEHNHLKMQWEQENKMMMDSQAAAQRQHGQNLINLGQQRMQANHSYINSMMERSNKQYQTQRDSYNSRMAAQDRMRDARSEAIRGVNTYIKPDGKEVEVSVSADTVWINGKGEIVGGSAGFNPGPDWTKLERK